MHLLHEVKEELDWTARELIEVERQMTALEKQLQERLPVLEDADERDAFIAEVEAQKSALNIFELYSILSRSEEHTSALQSHHELVCPLLLEKKKMRTQPPLATFTYINKVAGD